MSILERISIMSLYIRGNYQVFDFDFDIGRLINYKNDRLTLEQRDIIDSYILNSDNDELFPKNEKLAIIKLDDINILSYNRKYIDDVKRIIKCFPELKQYCNSEYHD